MQRRRVEVLAGTQGTRAALENLTGANLMKLFPSPRIPTEKIPECKPHLDRDEHLKLYRFSERDFQEVGAVFNGPHPETGEELVVAGVPHPDFRSSRPVSSPRSPEACSRA